VQRDSSFSDQEMASPGEPIVIANEFTMVRIRRMQTRHGERVEIACPGRGYRVLLDAMQLEAVASQRPETFSQMIAINLGSE
jgi:hypothetical protein